MTLVPTEVGAEPAADSNVEEEPQRGPCRRRSRLRGSARTSLHTTGRNGLWGSDDAEEGRSGSDENRADPYCGGIPELPG